MSLIRKSPIKSFEFRQIFTLSDRFFTATATATATTTSLSRSSDRPNTAHYDELVNAAGKSGDFDELRRLVNKRMKDGFYNTTNTFNFVTRRDASPSAVAGLCEILAGLDAGVVRKGAFDALVARLCKIGRADESLLVIDAMARAECGLGASTFHPVTKALTRRKEIDGAWRVVDRMRALGVSPDATVFNHFLATHCAAGDVEAAAAVLGRMLGQGQVEGLGLKPDGRTYDALVLGACRAGKVEGALVLLRRMEDYGVPMLLSTRLYVVDALLSLGYYDQAVRFVRAYGGRDTWLDAESFGCLATRLMKLNRMEEARMVLDEMRTRGLEIRDTLKSLLNRL